MSLNPLQARVLAASALVSVGGALLIPQVVSAEHSESSVSCDGLSVSLRMYGHIDYTATIVVNGVAEVYDFSGNLDVYVPFDPEQTNTWSYDVDSTERSNVAVDSGVEEACIAATTTVPPTTQAPTTTAEPTTTVPPTTAEPTTVTPTTDGPTTTDAPSTTDTPGTTDGPTTTGDPGTTTPTTNAPATTVVDADSGERPEDPAVPSTNQTLPATGVDSSLGAVIGGSLVLVGGAVLFAGRRKRSAAS